MLFAVVVQRGDQTRPWVLTGFGGVACGFCDRVIGLGIAIGQQCPGCHAVITEVDRRGQEMGGEI